MTLESTLLFVGEQRSELAIKLGLTWKDGGLAAKQLFDALRLCNIDPANVSFTNWFERGGKKIVREWEGTIIAMGQKVHLAMNERNISHLTIVHPAARGKIRRKDLYADHVKTNLKEILNQVENDQN